MEPRQTLILVLIFTLYLVFGALVFWYLESEEEISEPYEWTQLKELALAEAPQGRDELGWLVTWLRENCLDIPNSTISRLVADGSQPEALQEAESLCPYLQHIEYFWTFMEALYLCMTILTTVGYGAQYPITIAGRVICCIYAVIGLVITGMMLVWTSNIFSELLFRLFKAKLDSKKQQCRKTIALCTSVIIAIGFVVFVFIPAVIFMVVEHWSYLDAVYFAIISLTTIGFGDLVTGTEMRGWELYVYQTYVTVWMVAGLAYWATVANFITKVLKSKRQSSLLRSAEEMKLLLQQMGVQNSDPRLASFMRQLSNIIGVEKVALIHDVAHSSSTSAPVMNPTAPLEKPSETSY
ncbi:open rectifier potassium channel protein 1-like [Penaeus japonicus]|uniref:open rectifier potassium channel protein 1-like n=1 Tax=Penaeus japonicus TaxID=27405 RepID=UPI001C7106C5|nr:open rectifier potassium channel protein 1-like [Penaeus japonicus]